MARMRSRKVLVACLAALCGIGTGVPATPAGAQAAGASSSLSVSPPTSELDATPGQVITQKIGLDNIADTPQTVAVQVQNFAAQGEQGQAELTQEEGPYALSQWITVTPARATLPAHGHQDFQARITVPPNAPPGGHFGALVFAPQTTTTNNGASLSVVAQVTSLVLLRVPGNATEKASVAAFDVCRPSKGKELCDRSQGFVQKGPLTMSLRVKNEGNVQVKPQGTITVYNVFGSKVATIPVEARNVLPDSVRRFDLRWKHGTLFGRYKIKADLTYGTSNQTIHVEKAVWAAPVKTVLLVVVAVVVLFLIVWLPRKRLRKAFKALASSD